MDDCILADWIFNIKEELSALGATIKIPSFMKGKKTAFLLVKWIRKGSYQEYEPM